MGIVIALILLALVIGGLSLVFKALRWLIIISLVLFVASGVAGYVRGRRAA